MTFDYTSVMDGAPQTNGEITPMLKTKTITLKIHVRAEEHNVLADALAGDVEKILREHHKVVSALFCGMDLITRTKHGL
jgi:hypothetical protein